MKISAFGLTDKGRVRAQNEDSLYVDTDNNIYAVADGLGGLPKGNVASGIAVQKLEEAVKARPKSRLNYQELFNSINKVIYEEGQTINKEIGIGTTLSCLQIEGNKIYIGHVGDCSTFLFRNNELYQLTTDHTMEEEIRARLKPGEDTYIPEYFAHTLTRCLGQSGSVEADEEVYDVQPGDRIVICSDGLPKCMEPEEIMAKTVDALEPEKLVKTLINISNERGSPDNVTSIAIFFDE